MRPLRVMRPLRRFVRDQSGYTLVELIFAATIFIIISVVAVGVLVSVLQSSSKTAAQRAVQQDIRVNIEEIARTARASGIDYEFYERNAGQPRCAIDDTPGSTLPTGSNVLPLFWTEAVPGGEPNRKRVIFFFDAGVANDDFDGILYRYEADEGAPTLSCNQLFATVGSATTVRLTSPDVATTRAKFFVSPLSNPYGSPCPGPVPDVNCQLPRNTHPRVTMSVTVQTMVDPASVTEQSEFSQTTIQTTVGTRAYPITGLVGQQ
ncbi:MAG: hypothetical protein WD926_01370 [Patescibacteria group bacterium]